MNIAVLKVRKEDTSKLVEIAGEIGNAIEGVTFILPFDSELLTGKLAKEELESFHQNLHTILGI